MNFDFDFDYCLCSVFDVSVCVHFDDL